MGTNPNNAVNMITPSGKKKYAFHNVRDFTQDRLVLYVLTAENTIDLMTHQVSDTVDKMYVCN